VSLPGIDPQAVARLIHEDPSTSHTRIIAIAEDGSVEKVGFDDVLQHPIAKRAVRRITGPLPSLAK
jgi:CheY-like chemotaxis protein